MVATPNQGFTRFGIQTFQYKAVCLGRYGHTVAVLFRTGQPILKLTIHKSSQSIYPFSHASKARTPKGTVLQPISLGRVCKGLGVAKAEQEAFALKLCSLQQQPLGL